MGTWPSDASLDLKAVGIRLAFGARRADVLNWLLRRGAAPIAVGVVLGVAGATLLGGVLEGLVFDTADVRLTLLTASAILTGAGAVASFVPALRASREDPSRLLRSE